MGGILLALTAWGVMPLFGWRVLVALSSLPLAVFLCSLPWCPESPLYLATTGKETEVHAQINRVSQILQYIPFWKTRSQNRMHGVLADIVSCYDSRSHGSMKNVL